MLEVTERREREGTVTSDGLKLDAQVMESREWRAIAAALASNPQLQQLLQDPTPLEANQLAVAPLDAPPTTASAAVTEADFSDDA